MNDDDYAELFRKLPSGESSGSSWREVAAEFEALGNTLGEVLRRAWRTQGLDSGLGQLRELLTARTDELNRTIDGTPEAAQARHQLARLIEALQAAAERASAEVRPQLLTLLREANAALRRQMDQG
jgi:hypothetical protein